MFGLYKYLVILYNKSDKELSVWTCIATARSYIKFLISIGYKKEDIELMQLRKYPLLKE